jgi:hypothetical protein
VRYLLIVLVCLLVLGLGQLVAQTNGEERRPFTAEEKAQLAAKILEAPAVEQKGARPTVEKAKRRRVLSVTVPATTETLSPEKVRRRIARVIVFDYDENKATGLLVDASTAEVLKKEPIRGRPQRSAEEKQDAIKIVQQDPKLAQSLQANAVIEGGFIVDGPQGAPSKHRFLQLQLLTPDRTQLRRRVIVDLTAGTIAASEGE